MEGSLEVEGDCKNTIDETIKKNLEVNGLSMNMIYERTLWYHLIHVAEPM